MGSSLQKVAEFHLKHAFPIAIKPGENPKMDLVRVHLIAEELGELALGIANKDIQLIADALGDLKYVVDGAAVTYGIPLEEVFDEIHRSNMTKAVRKPGDTRLRDKGASYVPPDIVKVMSDFYPNNLEKDSPLQQIKRLFAALSTEDKMQFAMDLLHGTPT
jgi:NTP pyrophosphatase (non-canonical NTP hydrolase)